ncbi:Aralkylamine dehydrogenase heavy chain [Pandoraea terrae]|uniref:Aralkylamine dehydrogenase heavy chain n=1 Tax=Pandoraea terrae TaxID=1537710 RepID=A0A5E4RPP3_9BURK|nr:amine dehydrogenase large subunit [Pandoraea terrae]VVD65356.1 Aralkylamine dehydrogenase heavy chain [Pandoraea terrae]
MSMKATPGWRALTSMALTLWIMTAQAQAQTKTLPPPLAAETLRTAPMPPRNPHWLYAIDVAISHLVDGKVVLYDAERRKIIGQLGAGFMPGFATSPDQAHNYIATSYFARGTRGDRTDVLEIADTATFDKNAEVVLPPKHAQEIATGFNTSISRDGRFAYVTNITPATSVSVVDLARRLVVGEVDTAACVLAFPSGNRRFTSLCESGRALTVTLGDDGREVAREQSAPFIDVEKDPVYINAQRLGEKYLFLSFHGDIYGADFSSDKATFDAPWPLLTPADKAAGWRPGGNQPFAVHAPDQRLYVAMHRGGEGSHKDAGTEIWVYDIAKRTRIARWNLLARKLEPMIAVEVSQDDKPLLYGTNGTDLMIMDARTGQPRHVEKGLGELLVQLVKF